MSTDHHSDSSARRSKRSAAVLATEKNHEIYNHDKNESAAKKSRSSSGKKGNGDKSSQMKVKEVKAEEAVKIEEEEEVEFSEAIFVGYPVAAEEAMSRWPHRYIGKTGDNQSACTQKTDPNLTVQAKCHYLQAKVDGCLYNLNDDAYIKADKGMPSYIGRITELFKGVDNKQYFTALWFFRAEDTAIKGFEKHHDSKRLFLSDDSNDNDLNSLVKNIKIICVPAKIDFSIQKDASKYDYYYDMSFSVGYSSFSSLPNDDVPSVTDEAAKSNNSIAVSESKTNKLINGEKKELVLLDLYSGCGAMSTGLCLGANLSGVNLKTGWAVDMNECACESFQYNHPETQVRNENAENFLTVLREWILLLKKYGVEEMNSDISDVSDGSISDEEPENTSKSEEFEVGKIVGIRYGSYVDDGKQKEGLQFKVHWKGYNSKDDDTWEPATNLSSCEDKIKEFVINGYRNNILPLPGKVDVVCGGPPCQGASGFNRFRKVDDPFEDEKNKQMAVYMNIVDYLKPRYVLMENVVDILKFAKGYLGRYALSRLVSMHYQARLGILAAGNYGLPQYRMRVFLWGAKPDEVLPQLPLPSHDVVVRGAPPVEFETHVVAYEQGLHKKLEKALLLEDAISDLPLVENDEEKDEMSYQDPPKTDFQRYIRLSRNAMSQPLSGKKKPSQNEALHDHRPLKLNEDDYQRVCRIPKHKGANFRDLPGIIVGSDNVVKFDPNVERVLLPSGKPLIPDYAMTYVDGKSSKPFGRLWWDETVSTVVTRAEPHNQKIIHPSQDRVLTIRENARLQGFPDYYKLFGSLKQRYIQVGNAVAVPVSRALGFGLGKAVLREVIDDEPVFSLPQNFPANLC